MDEVEVREKEKYRGDLGGMIEGEMEGLKGGKEGVLEECIQVGRED